MSKQKIQQYASKSKVTIQIMSCIHIFAIILNLFLSGTM